MQDFPKRAHRWHRLMVCGVHLALAAVHATHALLLTADIVAFMMSHKEETERPVDVVGVAEQLGRENRIIRSERFVIHRKSYI